MDYGRIFSRAWQLCWNNKYVFLLGFLAALGSGATSGGQFNYSFSAEDLPPGFAPNLERFFAALAPLALGLICVAFLLGIILWLVRLVAQAGLISAADRLDAGEDVSLGDALSAGVNYLLRMAGLNIIIYLPLWIIGGISLAGLLAALVPVASSISPGRQPSPDLVGVGAAAAILALCTACCIFVFVALLINVIYPFAQRGLVLGNLGVLASIGHGWRVVRDNIGDVILLIIIFLVLGFLFGLVVSLLMIPLGFLAIGPTMLGLMAGRAIDAGDILLLIGSGLVLGLISALVNAIYIAYRSVTVTLAYQEFVGKEKGPEPAVTGPVSPAPKGSV
ncbi:MAG TPA: hypothetical protein VK879_11105 [Candidatus Sulfomarinibacteraceae bacterium]|nr:hypothetical protein [Candidatus Sulfomarinibacteraceae bacterium]